jgi:heme-degrading monooxygenase HmoA
VFVTIRRYDAGPTTDEIGRRVRDGLVPLLRKQPGFRAYYAFASDDGRPVAVSVFDSRAAAMAANERARAWAAENASGLLPNPPEVMSGEMQHGVVPPRPQRGGVDEVLHVTIRTYDGVASVDRVFLRTRSTLVPLIKGQAGLRSYCSFGSEQVHGRIVSVTAFDSAEAAAAANERVREAIAAELSELLPKPPEVMAGQTFVAATV